MSYRGRKMHRSGITIIETALSIAILGVLLGTAVTGTISTKRTMQLQKERDFFRTFENGTKTVMTQIVDSFSPVCSNITSDGQSSWGWSHASCSATSVFPTFLSNDKMRYTIDFGSLTAAEGNNLANSILNAFSPYCQLDSRTATEIDLLCPTIRDIKYDLGSGDIATAHAVGADIDPLVPPIVKLTVSRKDNDGAVRNQTFNFSFIDVYDVLRIKSIDKINHIKNILKTFQNTVMTVEVLNAPDKGLNSIDDEFVPWFWESFGDDPLQAVGAVCDKAGATKCGNLETDNIWRSTLSSAGLYPRKLSSNLLSGDMSFFVDGFGNQITYYPFMSQCTNNDISTCTVAAPVVAQDNYFNIMRPPYVSALYIDTYKDKTIDAPSYGRSYISF